MATILRHEATNQTLRAGKGWKDQNGIQHPSNWNIWSTEDKTAAGITEIVQANPPDSRFYIWSYNELGLKSNLKLDVNIQQGSLLDQTDWYIVRKADNATTIPSNIQTWRDAIRIKGDAMKSAIDGAADTDALGALFVVYDRDGVLESGVLYDWPILET
jgi:hypothetical protein